MSGQPDFMYTEEISSWTKKKAILLQKPMDMGSTLLVVAGPTFFFSQNCSSFFIAQFQHSMWKPSSEILVNVNIMQSFVGGRRGVKIDLSFHHIPVVPLAWGPMSLDGLWENLSSSWNTPVWLKSHFSSILSITSYYCPYALQRRAAAIWLAD